jgi:hypothetical protein
VDPSNELSRLASGPYAGDIEYNISFVSAGGSFRSILVLVLLEWEFARGDKMMRMIRDDEKNIFALGNVLPFTIISYQICRSPLLFTD